MISLKTSDFDYILPPELIAQTPVEPRDHSRLLVVNRSDGSLAHRRFFDLPQYLKPGDVLVFNNSRVIRARLFGNRLDNGRKIEILLLRRIETNLWETLVRSKKKVSPGLQIAIDDHFNREDAFPSPHSASGERTADGGAASQPENKKPGGIKAEVISLEAAGVRIVRFSDESALPQVGEVPLPPYIHTPLTDPERYQTVYAKQEGSVAAPTAGLHFTPGLLDKIKDMGAECLFVTLHVGLNTFRPVRTETITEHPIFPEYGVIDETAAERINLAKAENRRVICVGTTSVRLVESAAHARESDGIKPWDGWVNDFIYPGYRFKIMDTMITNFHLPKSTLMMLVSAFAGKDLIFQAYREAIDRKYRFYSFGDAMLIL